MFRDHFINIMEAFTNTTQFSILMNGSLGPFFIMKRVIRQGDPLSPYMFIMIADVLGKNLLNLVDYGQIKGLLPLEVL